VGENRTEYKVLAGNTEGTRSLGRPGKGGYCKRKMKKFGLEGENWTLLAQYTDRWLAFLKTVMKLRFP
jgi:hypothetical protein